MRGAGGVLAVAVATLLVCCSADNQESDVNGNEHAGERFEPGGHKAQNMAHLNLVRSVREAGHYGFLPNLINRRIEYASPYAAGGWHEQWPEYSGGYYGEGLPKRNFDEIDRSSLNTFVRKRNFDEIDQTSMPFPFKRYYRYKGAIDEVPMYERFDKKEFRHHNNMDEIDLSPFPIGSKRNGVYDKKMFRNDNNMDEIDLSPFPIGSKRSLH